MKPRSSYSKSPSKAPAEQVVKDIRRQTRRHFSAEDKIRIVLEGLRGDDSIAEGNAGFCLIMATERGNSINEFAQSPLHRPGNDPGQYQDCQCP